MLIDQFNRKINYIRVSVTDRCDFRCVYCISEKMTFMPRNDLLSLEEIARVIKIFNGSGAWCGLLYQENREGSVNLPRSRHCDRTTGIHARFGIDKTY